MGNLIAVVDAAGGESTFQYNAAGWLTKAFDALERETRYTYDAAGRVTAIERPPYDFTTTFAYDLAGNLTQVDRPGGRRTSFVYDQLNRLEREQDVYGNFDQYTYDAEGRVLAHTDRIGRKGERGTFYFSRKVECPPFAPQGHRPSDNPRARTQECAGESPRGGSGCQSG